MVLGVELFEFSSELFVCVGGLSDVFVVEGGNEIFGGESGEGGIFAGEVSGEPKDLTGASENVLVIVFDLVLAGVLVGFVDNGKSGIFITVDQFAGHLHGGGDFFGMVGVIGEDASSELFEATTGTRERIESSNNVAAADAESWGGFKCHQGNGGKGELGIKATKLSDEVEPGDWQGVDGGNDLLALATELVESFVVIGGGSVGVGVVVGFGGDDAEPGVEGEEIAVVFVGFVYEEVAVGSVLTGAGPG